MEYSNCKIVLDILKKRKEIVLVLWRGVWLEMEWTTWFLSSGCRSGPATLRFASRQNWIEFSSPLTFSLILSAPGFWISFWTVPKRMCCPGTSALSPVCLLWVSTAMNGRWEACWSINLKDLKAQTCAESHCGGYLGNASEKANIFGVVAPLCIVSGGKLP